MSERVRLLLVDDHPVFLDGLRALLASEPWVAEAELARTSAEAVELCRSRPFDVAVVDLRLPDGDGVELTRRLLALRPGLRVLVLTMYADSDAVVRALGSGAAGYVLKDAEPEDVRAAVQQVSRGAMVVGAGAASLLQVTMSGSPVDLSGLTDRQRELLDLLALGLNTAAIAARLHVSTKTVRNRVSELLAVLGVSSRAEAIVLARDAGLGRDDLRRPPS
jgi:DNA-binding NarL/FixJ family response regulator